MTPLEHLVTLLLCTFAVWSTIGAIRRTTATDPGTTRLKLAALIAGPPLLLLTVGVPFLTVIGYYLAGFVLLYGLALILSLSRYGLGATVRNLQDLPRHATAADHPPRRGQQRRGPQPPRRAVQVDREYAYDRYAPYTFEDGRILDLDRSAWRTPSVTPNRDNWHCSGSGRRTPTRPGSQIHPAGPGGTPLHL